MLLCLCRRCLLSAPGASAAPVSLLSQCVCIVSVGVACVFSVSISLSGGSFACCLAHAALFFFFFFFFFLAGRLALCVFALAASASAIATVQNMFSVRLFVQTPSHTTRALLHAPLLLTAQRFWRAIAYPFGGYIAACESFVDRNVAERRIAGEFGANGSRTRTFAAPQRTTNTNTQHTNNTQKQHTKQYQQTKTKQEKKIKKERKKRNLLVYTGPVQQGGDRRLAADLLRSGAHATGG